MIRLQLAWQIQRQTPVRSAQATQLSRPLAGKAMNVGTEKAATNALIRKIIHRDPWTIYTAKALVRAGHEAALAIRRDDPAKLVHIQTTRTDLALVERAVQKVSRFAHRRFLCLLDVLHHQSTCYLVWEPAEFALDRILISRCRIQEDELGQFIRPVRARLSGIRGALTVGRL
ncbi:hypothetical protein ASPCAL15099 [Aspergillus calidoustus]|uniref:Uncharacterized protein n=1 Tax=Aspergillus calidoustus TaxID=454130 RepID=A0A0U4ZRL9_ASPCI|nr:hypothetical protein ASPCAL15099 [Aspergillus calidoustus]